MISLRLTPAMLGTGTALALIVLATVLAPGCTSQSKPIVSVNTPSPSAATAATLPDGVTVTRVEVVHFHPTRQCDSCITVGNYANATVTTYFADELKSGKVAFREVNGELPENREIVERYGASGSSLFLGVYTSDGGFYPEENIKVWYRTDNKQRYMDYLKGVIEKRLAGDLSSV
jgi:hypothetical protein